VTYLPVLRELMVGANQYTDKHELHSWSFFFSKFPLRKRRSCTDRYPNEWWVFLLTIRVVPRYIRPCWLFQ